MQSLDQFALTTKPVLTFLKYRRKKGHSRKRTERSEVHLKAAVGGWGMNLLFTIHMLRGVPAGIVQASLTQRYVTICKYLVNHFPSLLNFKFIVYRQSLKFYRSRSV